MEGLPSSREGVGGFLPSPVSGFYRIQCVGFNVVISVCSVLYTPEYDFLCVQFLQVSCAIVRFFEEYVRSALYRWI